MPKGRKLQGTAREIILRVENYFIRELDNNGPVTKLSQVQNRVAEATGVSLRTLQRIRIESQTAPKSTEGGEIVLRTPRKKRRKKAPVLDLDDFDVGSLRHIVHRMYAVGMNPTISKILEEAKVETGFSGSRESMRKILHRIGFKWKQFNNRRLLFEHDDIVIRRRQFLRRFRDYRQRCATFVWLDETWVNMYPNPRETWQEDKVPPQSPGCKFVIAHAGTASGFLNGASLIFKPDFKLGDSNAEMNGSIFRTWFEKQLLPNLPPSSVIVMDDASCHSSHLEEMPSGDSKKPEIQQWLDRHGILYRQDELKLELLKRVKTSRAYKTCAVESLAEVHGHKLMRLPPFHTDLNPIQLILAQCKLYYEDKNACNTIFTEESVRNTWDEALAHVNPCNWENACKHVDLLALRYWDNDGIIEEQVEQLALTGDSSDSNESESESNDEEEEGDDY